MAVSMGVGHLVMLGVELAAAGRTGAAVAATLRERAPDLDLYVAFDTLEYVRKGGRLSPARAAIGTMLSVKPIITVVDGLVETADRVRTRAKARERVIQLLRARPAVPTWAPAPWAGSSCSSADARAAVTPSSSRGTDCPGPGPMVAGRIRAGFGTIAVGFRAIPPGASVPVRHSRRDREGPHDRPTG